MGHANDPGVDILSIIHQFDLPMDFPEEVYEEVSSVESEISEDEIKEEKTLEIY